MGNVLEFKGFTTLKLDPDAVLDAAKGKVISVLILGMDTEGEPYFAASSDASVADLHLFAARFQKFLLENYK